MRTDEPPDDDIDYFEYPTSWTTEYLAHRTVEEWWRTFPDQFDRNPGARRPGNLQYFAQYALMYLLRRDYDIKSLTWLHLAAVDDQTRRCVAAGKPCVRACPKPCKDTEKRGTQWQTMRALMGATKFDALQTTIVAAGFAGYTGEPDLFCYTDSGIWFFAEAKTAGERLGRWQQKWIDIAKRLRGVKCPIYLCRVVPQDRRPSTLSEHSARWNRMMRTRS